MKPEGNELPWTDSYLGFEEGDTGVEAKLGKEAVDRIPNGTNRLRPDISVGYPPTSKKKKGEPTTDPPWQSITISARLVK